jgi:catechol 2,3-dioxygenase-like lactoylglutathione lyase family enzyme
VIDHLSIQCADLEASLAFYDTVLEPLGGRRLMQAASGAYGYGVDFPSFWLGPVTTGGEAREAHIAFRASSRAAVTAFYEAALATGAESLHAPREWPEYHSTYFGAFVRDPDGNNVEAVCHSGGSPS